MRKPKTPTYRSWLSARERCRSKNCNQYPYYGGRGICFDPVWDDFDRFASDMGERPLGCTLDRIDNDGDYTPGNCRWATPKEQARNRRNASAVNTLTKGRGGVAELAESLGITYGALMQRLKRGWTLKLAIRKPVMKPLRYVEWRGKRMRMKEAAEQVGLPPAVVQHRIVRGWPIEEALSRPKGNYRGRS